jgi:hypothetical protein
MVEDKSYYTAAIRSCFVAQQMAHKRLLIMTCKGHLYVVCYLFLTAKVNSNKPGLLTTYVTMPG